MTDAMIESICCLWPAGEEHKFIAHAWDQLTKSNSDYQCATQLIILSLFPGGGAGAVLLYSTLVDSEISKYFYKNLILEYFKPTVTCHKDLDKSQFEDSSGSFTDCMKTMIFYEETVI